MNTLKWDLENFVRLLGILILVLGMNGSTVKAPPVSGAVEKTSERYRVEDITPVVLNQSQPQTDEVQAPVEAVPVERYWSARKAQIGSEDLPEAASMPAPRTQRAPEDWKNWPIIPAATASARQIYARGLELGNHPGAFTRIGDCGSTPTWFLGDFDKGPRFYNLGEYTNLETVIEHYQGSFGHDSVTSRRGFSAAAALSLYWADPELCEPGETPVACEYRLHRPSVALIMLGSNDYSGLDAFESRMRAILDYSVEKGVVPVLVTKADNHEGGDRINAVIARLAWEYDLPLWNFWAAAQTLPQGGLLEDGQHLSWGPNDFSEAYNLRRGWTVRNLTALQTLDSIWNGLDGDS